MLAKCICHFCLGLKVLGCELLEEFVISIWISVGVGRFSGEKAKTEDETGDGPSLEVGDV